MTPLTKPISRRGCMPCHGRTLAVTLYPGDVIGVRQSGTRTEYTLPLAAIYSLAVRIEVQRKKAEKAAAKQANKKARK